VATARSTGKLIHLHVSNPSKALAFQVAAELDDAQGAKLSHISWSDNYIELMPGEECDLTATLPEVKPEWKVKIDGWNVEPLTLTPHATAMKPKSGS
jgi:exo-1,4-beta-D-glucosaminidase